MDIILIHEKLIIHFLSFLNISYIPEFFHRKFKIYFSVHINFVLPYARNKELK